MSKYVTDYGTRRRWWFFAMKDKFPLKAEGWFIAIHQDGSP